MKRIKLIIFYAISLGMTGYWAITIDWKFSLLTFIGTMAAIADIRSEKIRDDEDED